MGSAILLEQSMFDLGSDWAVDERDWMPVRILLKELEREMAEKRVHLLQRLSTWLTAIRIFRTVERHKIWGNKTDLQERDLQFHRAMLTPIMGFGESLVMELRQHKEIDPVHIGARFEDVIAQLDSLRMNYQTYHGGMTVVRAEQIMEELFR